MAEPVQHRTPWTEEEVDLLVSEWGRSPLEEVAAVLGRTTEACRQRYYEWTWGRTEAAATKGLAVQAGRTHHAAAVHRRHHREEDVSKLDVCSSCWEVRAANGACGCD